jgi:hypothetical protein
MTSWQLVRFVAGSLILLSLALGIPGSPIYVNQWFLAFTAFVGVNLLQSALTKWCLMETIMRKLGARAGA